MDLANALESVFRAHLLPELASTVDDAPGLRETLAELADAATRTWPRAGAPADFIAHVAARMVAGKPLHETLTQLRTDDLALAWACSLGDRDALRKFREHHYEGLRVAAMRAGPAGHADDVAQRVMTRLLVTDGEKPAAIAKYAGRGSLKSWLEVTAMREARDAYRSDKAARHEASPVDMDRLMDGALDTAGDPELESLKKQYRQAFKEAFQRAFLVLDARQRTILRHEHFDGLDGAQIAAIYGVHKATVSRWRALARAALLKETRRIAEQEMNLSPKEFESLMRVIQSQLHLSLTRVLRDNAEDDALGGAGDGSEKSR